VQKYNINNQMVTLYQECLAVTDAGSEAAQSAQNQIVTGLLIWSASKPWGACTPAIFLGQAIMVEVHHELVLKVLAANVRS
jgi:hypothetical protein